MLCLALTAVLTGHDFSEDQFIHRHLTPADLARGSGYDEPMKNTSYGLRQYTIFDAQEAFINNPVPIADCSTMDISQDLFHLSHDIERLDLQEWLYANIRASSQAKGHRHG